ncbi:uncharacterized abhydrolase domain-containing protein DDB_G0269086-like [Anthonomus grandis grandis]|uniref:uncharacterized abhydrolase domain-containing protein DDB_G0269086-like n=1 Tax=Anthonomus grandis grandis TaxID=2921223 RepID=UPI002166168B|nr:uncharacterized abhydrolase domain-containing protein DDB_G0269086-like [Anthonomus grandis grandis]
MKQPEEQVARWLEKLKQYSLNIKHQSGKPQNNVDALSRRPCQPQTLCAKVEEQEECEHNGKIYANGQKLETNPGGECKVCYCRGGEVQCAEVSCYIRNDCDGKRVPGTCCPKYDHCPPIDSYLDSGRSSSPATELPTPKPAEANNTDSPVFSTMSSVPEDSNKVPDTSDIGTVAPVFEEIFKNDDGPRITIQEIIPERKEIPITAPPKIYISEPQGTLLIEESLPTNDSNDLSTDSEPDSSEVSEVFQHPPPVLRIGDKLLFLKQGEIIPEKDITTPDTVITIIGAEGLQRGGEEESLEVHEVKLEDVSQNASSDSSIEHNKETKEDHSGDTNDLELKLAESTHILSLVKRKDKIATTTTTDVTTSAITENIEAETTVRATIDEPKLNEQNKPQDTFISTEPETKPSTEAQMKNTEPLQEQNPAYPPIPDIMPAVGDASQKFDIELENESNTSAVEGKILPEVLGFLSNKTRNVTTEHSDWLKLRKNETLIDFKQATLPEELLNEKSPIDEEDSATEVITTPETTSEMHDSLFLLKEVIANDPDIGKVAEATTVEPKPKENDPGKVLEGPQLIAEVKINNDELERVTIEHRKFDEVTTLSTEAGTTVATKSIESLEVESGEQTTPRTNHSSILSAENASVENENKELEVSDMTQQQPKENSVELGSVEVSENGSEQINKEVEMLPVTTMGTTKQDVELINVLSTPKPTSLGKVESSTYELLPTPEEAKLKKLIKRAIKAEDDVFKDLEKELNEDLNTPHKSSRQEKEEADKIFKELLNETKGTGRNINKPRSKEEENIENISQALAGVALKGKLPDSNVFRLIGDLLKGQQK